MTEEVKNTFVNIDFSSDLTLLDALGKMVEVDDTDRSKFIRNLIRKEQRRRDRIVARRNEKVSA